MATLKRRLHRKNASGGYDVVYLQTTSDLVLMSDGSTTLTSKISNMDAAINGKAASNHTHSGYAAASHEHDHLNVQSTNEMNIAYGNTGAEVYFNYRGSNVAITDYIFSNGKGSTLARLSGLSKVGHTHSNYATTSTTTSLANRIAALESNTSLIYENSSVRNLKHAYFTVDPNTRYTKSSINDLSINVGFNISRAIYIACTPNFARVIDDNRYAYNYTNTQTNGQQIMIAHIENTYNTAYEYLLYVYFSGTTVYLRFQNRGRDAPLHCDLVDASTNWSFDIVCIQDF